MSDDVPGEREHLSIEQLAVLYDSVADLLAERDRWREERQAHIDHADAQDELIGELYNERHRLRALLDAIGRYAEGRNDETLGELLDARQALADPSTGGAPTREDGEHRDVEGEAVSALAADAPAVMRANPPVIPLPPESELVDGINQYAIGPGLSTRFGYCPRCRNVYPPDESHQCEAPT